MKADDFPHQPYVWAASQCGHITIGVAAAVLAQAVGLWWPLPLAIAAVYWVVAEYTLQRSALPLDGAVDTAFVAGGASLPAALAWHPWAAVGLCGLCGAGLAVGALRRAKR